MDEYKAGDLFLATDHANISSCNPGIGPNLDEYGPRFFDVSSMYDHRMTQMIKTTLESLGESVNYCSGDLLWINNSSVPSVALTKLAAGLSNDKVCFKGAVKTGISELMAVQHRSP